ncbi:GNAT family N-acetyltransferase [Gulosibacter chungangensis]|uniref:N-acetyltransferase n=1 Tax=Gulosibacter chungangensis TaxID=979746 RepID=A0A7J5BF72_9MICO|nr:GNAT family N-acetyltransferase [Gulosibacter chungangensis]KAB1644911.1 N-acetyltransferase [Gulosibacter chungangensis]
MSEVLVNGEVPIVRDDAENNRYVIEAGSDRLGLIDYRLRGENIALIHTEVDKSKSVPGLARLLVTEALADARARGLGVLPYCPYVLHTIDRNREDFLDLVPEGRRAEFKLD